MIYNEVISALRLGPDFLDIDQKIISGDEPVYDGVNDLAVSSVRAAVGSLQMLLSECFGIQTKAQIDRALVDRWCSSSVTPIGWQLPSVWDEFSQDYLTKDGRIRLHTNAAHHREKALSVLGNVTTVHEAKDAILSWTSEELEFAIVEVGGCAAKLRTSSSWQNHPQGIAVAKEPVIGWQSASITQPRWTPQSATRPLSGLRVLDLTRVIAGPVATRFLASAGAEVLRIDPPHWQEPDSVVDLTIGKRCAGLDLTKPEDHSRLIQLIKSADVLVHGYRKDALPKLGFDNETINEINPSMITVGINAYGATGPWSNRRGFDSLVQRSSGLAAVEGQSVRALPYQALDHSTGYLAAASVIQALVRQYSNGQTMRAHLSLARQAHLLISNGLIETALNLNSVAKGTLPNKYAFKSVEDISDWGKVSRLALPYEIEGVKFGWSTPANKLRSAQPNWKCEDIK